MISNESYIFFAVLAALALVALIYLLSPKMNLLDDIAARGAEIRTRLRELPLRVARLAAGRESTDIDPVGHDSH